MFYDVLAILFGLIAAAVAYLAVRLLIRRGWLLGWLRGMGGILLIGGSVLLALVAFDVFSYQQVLRETSVATLSFEKLDAQHYKVNLVDPEGNEQSYELRGDQWQLDARIIKWPGMLASWGVQPAYRLDRLAGRYYSLEQEQTGERTVHSLSHSTLGVDVWRFLQQRGASLPFVDARYGSATYLPMADDALFEVTLSHSGLLARPLNDPAESAIAQWR